MHFVLLRFSSLGDVVIQTSFASWLKSQFPDCKISFITSKEFTPLLIHHPHIDQVIGYQRVKGFKNFAALKALTNKIEEFAPIDFILDLHGTTRSFLFKLINCHIPALNLDKRRLERLLLVKFKINLLKNEKQLHERTIDDYQGLFQKFYDRSQLEQFLTAQTHRHGSITSSPKTFEPMPKKKYFDKYIVLAPVASFTPKRWPMDNFNNLARAFLTIERFKDYGVIVVAGPKDEYAFSFDSVVKDYPERAINLTGKTNLEESSEVIRQANLLIGNDTGMGHIAESFGVKVITIFGPTSEDFGFAPHRNDSKVISVDLWCRPCSTTGNKKCFRAKQFCMDNVTIDQVLKSIESSL